jgi:two-component system repressor protein LuxO
LLSYAWPGNVRQLQNVVRNVVVLHDGPRVELSMLPLPLGPSPDQPLPEPLSEPEALPPPAAELPDIVPLAEMERRMILAALVRTGDDVPRAAVLLEVNPSTIYRKLQAWKAAGKLG